MKKKPNIILITLDALRADHLGFMGYKGGNTPFMDSLAKKGVVFRNAFSVGAATPQGFTGIMSSTYPLDFGGYSRMTEERTLLPEVMQKAGYRTMGFHSNAYLSHYFGYDRGWNAFHYLNHFESGAVRPGMRSGTWQFKLVKIITVFRRNLLKYAPPVDAFVGFFERLASTIRRIFRDMLKSPVPAFFTAMEMNEEVKEAVDEDPETPLFLWVHYMDAHAPYGLFLRKNNGFMKKLESYLADYLFDFWSEYPRISKIFSRFYVKMYDAGIGNIDTALEQLFTHLSSKGIFEEDTVVFITADHGEEFGDHGGFQHMQKLFNENIKVPLVVLGPKHIVGEPRIVESPRSSMDIAPTAARIVGTKPPASFRGGDLFAEGERDVVSEIADHESDLSDIRPMGRSLAAEGHKLINDSKKMLFSFADGREENNLYEKEKEISSRLEKRLKEFRNK